jgi:hypothetical protein
MMRRISLISQPSGAGAAVTLEGGKPVRQIALASEQIPQPACLRPQGGTFCVARAFLTFSGGLGFR